MIYCHPSQVTDFPDLNREFLKLEGELGDTEAKLFLVNFLRHNLGLACELFSGFKMMGYQEAALKAWFHRNYSLNVWGRGCAKSTMAAIFCFMYPLFNPGTKILIAGPTFRTARFIFDDLERKINSPDAELLRQVFNIGPIRRADQFTWEIPSPNQSIIYAIPLNGEKIRGFRANVLILDEFLLLTESIVTSVLMPFLVANADVKERLEIEEREDEIISLGLMDESERTSFQDNVKMICLTSASFTFEFLYKKFCEWKETIYNPKSGKASYFISQVSYEAVPKALISKKVIEEAESGGRNHPVFQREYLASFSDGSQGYFSANKMRDCTIKIGEDPHLTLRGLSDKEYLVSIDPNMSESQTSDDFAICVMEYNKETGFGTVVHQYANHTSDLKGHVDYFYYILTHFNVVLVIIDTTGGGGMRFIEASNLSDSFKNNNLKLSFIEWDSQLENEEYIKMATNARMQYNLISNRICIAQNFTSSWIRMANEHLQENINYNRIHFGSLITPNDIVYQSVCNQTIDLDLMGLESKEDGGKRIEAIDIQDNLIQLVKDECALIEPTTSPQGHQTFDLPKHLKRDRSKGRARRDSYTALLLGNWACKCYTDLMKYKEVKVKNTFTPFSMPFNN